MNDLKSAFRQGFEKEAGSVLSKLKNMASTGADKVDGTYRAVGRKEIDFLKNKSDKAEELLENQEKLNEENLERVFGYGTSILIPGI